MALSLTAPTAADSERSLEDLELDLLLTALAEYYGYDFRRYSRASLKRRMRTAMAVAKVDSFSHLQARVLHNPAFLAPLIASVSVHVTAMFRDPSFYRALRQYVVPELRTNPFVRIWVAGCATGEEVHSLAIVLEEEQILHRCRIYATDISDELVKRAARGVYPIGALRTYTQNYQRACGTRAFSDYYTADQTHVVFPDRLRANVVFSQHNLACDGAFNEFHLILCRNVMIYFGPELRDHVHELLHASLCRFGVLALGLKETLMRTPAECHYEPLVEDQRIFRRIR